MSSQSPALKAEYERIARERFAAERLVSRTYRREFARVCFECVCSSVLGLVLMRYALHTTDLAIGHISWLAGMVIGYAGIAMSLGAAYLRGERRGDW